MAYAEQHKKRALAAANTKSVDQINKTAERDAARQQAVDEAEQLAKYLRDSGKHLDAAALTIIRNQIKRATRTFHKYISPKMRSMVEKHHQNAADNKLNFVRQKRFTKRKTPVQKKKTN